MALLTEDIILNQEDGWVAIVLTGTVIHITDIRGSDIVFRMGISSTSIGIKLNSEASLSIDETIYVKPVLFGNNKSIITVTKD